MYWLDTEWLTDYSYPIVMKPEQRLAVKKAYRVDILNVTERALKTTGRCIVAFQYLNLSLKHENTPWLLVMLFFVCYFFSSFSMKHK